jgi:hypothetical protein
VPGVQTFVVRVFRSEHEIPAEPRPLRGLVEDIAAGSRTAFSDAAQLLAILGQDAPPPGRAGGAALIAGRQERSTSQPPARRTR